MWESGTDVFPFLYVCQCVVDTLWSLDCTRPWFKKKGTGVGALQQCCFFFLLLSGILNTEILQLHFYHASFVRQTQIHLP